ncbi:hypothetical protein KM043_010553 [Ampulex compressa]|nr:hypothetical protein KM043_010553 [Ampulex compressa]
MEPFLLLRLSTPLPNTAQRRLANVAIPALPISDGKKSIAADRGEKSEGGKKNVSRSPWNEGDRKAGREEDDVRTLNIDLVSIRMPDSLQSRIRRIEEDKFGD